MAETPNPGGVGQRLWDVLADGDPAREALLTEACRTLDELQSLREELVGGPLTVAGSRGQPRPSPLLDEVRRHRDCLARLLRALRPEDVDADADAHAAFIALASTPTPGEDR